MNIEIANRLVQMRKQKGLSQEELAEKLGLSRQAVSKWERAEASPDTDNLICLAKLYGISLDDLLNTDQPVEEIARDVKEENARKEEEAKQQEEPKEEEVEAETVRDGEEMKQPNRLKFDWFSFEPYGFDSVEMTGHSLIFYDKDGNVVPFRGERNIAENGVAVHIEEDEVDVAIAHGRAYIHIEPDEYSYKAPNGKSVHCESDHGWKPETTEEKNWKIIDSVVFSILGTLALGAYLFTGFYYQNLGSHIGWACWWVLLLAPIIVQSIMSAIHKKKMTSVAIPIVCLFVYIPFGFYMNLWHPMWAVFLLIPIWYSLFGSIQKIQENKKEASQDEQK